MRWQMENTAWSSTDTAWYDTGSSILQQGKMWFLILHRNLFLICDCWDLVVYYHVFILSCVVTPSLFCDPSGIRPGLQHGA